MKEIKKHLMEQADTARRRAERAESTGRHAAKEAANEFARAENYRKQAEEFLRLAEAQPE